MLMQTPALRYFLAVVRTGSISAAAQRLRVAGSAVSRQIANLEKELDAALFERRSHGMILTQAGQTLAAYAQRLELESEQVVSEIREFDIDSGSGEAVVDLSAKLIAEGTGKVVNARIFTARVPVPKVDAQTAATGLDAALSQVLGDLVRWVNVGR